MKPPEVAAAAVKKAAHEANAHHAAVKVKDKEKEKEKVDQF